MVVKAKPENILLASLTRVLMLMILIFACRNFYLTDGAYTWYVNLKSGLTHDWEHLISLFKCWSLLWLSQVLPIKLSQTRQHLAEHMDMCVRRFHEKTRLLWSRGWGGAWYFFSPSHVGRISYFLGNLSLPTFFELTEVACCINESVRMPSKSNSAVLPSYGSTLDQWRGRGRWSQPPEKGKEGKPSNLKKPAYGRREPRQFPVLSHFIVAWRDL